MKKFIVLISIILIGFMLLSCNTASDVQIAATTLPVYEFTARLCAGTDITVAQLVTENISCLHDYSLQVSQMRTLESAETVIISGGGLEDFLGNDFLSARCVIDASKGIALLCPDDAEAHSHHDAHDHAHEADPHIWLSPTHAKTMAQNICDGLVVNYPEYADIFRQNLSGLKSELDVLQAYGQETLSQLQCREIITFHDGFSYLAACFDLTICKAIEEESGREASAAELKELIGIVETHQLPAVFIEKNGSVSAAEILSTETGCEVYTLDMAMSGEGYFIAMYHNIDILKEALG